MNYTIEDNIAIVTMDDGKANAVGHGYLDGINEALDRAEKEMPGAIVLRGREGMFSAGFDLKEFTDGSDGGVSMVKRGMELLMRLYSFPLPVVAACTGHGIAMGVFIIMACDYRVGLSGPFKLTLPETALGMTLPGTMFELTLSRVPPQFITRAVIQSEVFDPDQAVGVGFLDDSISAEGFDARVLEVATRLAGLPQREYAANKLTARRQALAAMSEEYQRMVKENEA